MGDAGGDKDWYGYCLDDPVNGVDPLGLFPFLPFLPFLAGMTGATAISGTGAYTAAKAADWAGKKTDPNYGKNKPTATEGVHDAMNKIIGINSSIVGAAGAAKAAPTLIGTVMQHPDKLASGSKAVADFASGALDKGPAPMSQPGIAGTAARMGYDWYKEQYRR